MHPYFKGNMVMVYVDGVFQGYRIWPDKRAPLLGAADTEFILGETFNGLLFDLNVGAKGSYEPHAIKEGVACPWRFPNSLGENNPEGVVLGALLLNEGVGPMAKAGAVTGTAGHWRVATFDDATTSRANVALEGKGLTSARSGETGRFVVEAKSVGVDTG